ncbi:hypothetical protein BBJ28_00009322 [Nothophytophthora sp. Chile5]|nr:hypothetical protein BBJ28_00009322 [Nothophytophthora sp. Chile5]
MVVTPSRASGFTSDDGASSGGRAPRQSPFLLLLCLPMTLALWAMSIELSWITTSLDDESVRIQRVLEAAAAMEGDPDASWTSESTSSTFYPDEVFAVDWTSRIEASDILHQNALHHGCVEHKNNVIPWTYGRPGQNESESRQQLIEKDDPELLAKLRECPDVDLFLPEGLRSFGYCEDAAAYTKFLESRMLPRWVLEVSFEDTTRNRSVTYHDLCPNTPLIFFNHYWEGLLEAADWPAAKPLYLMPNMEMYELESEHYWRANVILCKTALCERYLRKWFRQEGNPRGTRVLYTRHTTSKLALTIHSQRNASEANVLPVKNVSDVSFLHTAGTSYQKGTRQVLDCWLSRPDLPPLELYVEQSRFDELFKARYGTRIDSSSNIYLHTGQLEPASFAHIISEARYVLCPSLMEGYGHYINQARSSRAFIFTTDVAPMSELITPSSGALIQARVVAHEGQFLGGTSKKPHALKGVPGFVANFGGRAVCSAVLGVLKYTTPEERARRADKALQQYYFDTVFFAQTMRELRVFARAKSHSGRLPGNLRRHEGGAETSLQPQDAKDK